MTLLGGTSKRLFTVGGGSKQGSSNLKSLQSGSKVPLSLSQLKYFSSNNGDNRRHPNDGPLDHSYYQSDDRFKDSKPTVAYAKGMPRSFSAMRHEQILQLCVEGSHQARREALVRNVMTVDNVEQDDAAKVVSKISEENRSLMYLEYLPYHTGIAIAGIFGVVSFPMMFHADTVLWFNEKFVTFEVPESADIVIGQASFIFLVLQFVRSQAINLGLKPYGHKILGVRSKRMCKKYPQYDPIFLEWFSESDALYGKQKN
eukprot:CAMPEP_0194077882 /NCGR_PEP_ID=MMETSP0149-20130528/4426_1 /TAXON_ID=122233 /ORGANISM="Chaetoceros debilis, Strain MM31A-1" /LENGTH=257 /DNA_ID=CAMNT_0038759031 /DNA_START=193 /DNA_END=966 /DNA_ORIENTATION=+